jgi:glycosyltransferase involved in cell wall biosynthesis
MFYDEKYKIGSIPEEAPMCIFTIGYKTFSKNMHTGYFSALQKLNYTNYHVVYIDDNSPQEEIDGLLGYLTKANFNFLHHLTIIHNLQHLGPVTNMYLGINKFCNEDDIVVIVDADDALVGSQPLKVLNALYNRPTTWFLYSRYITKTSRLDGGFSRPMQTSTSSYRAAIDLWDVSHIRTFRSKLFRKISLDAILEYHYDSKLDLFFPHFYSYATDNFQIFPMLEMAGEANYKHIPDYLYLYSGASRGERCYMLHEFLDSLKVRIKTPFVKLGSLADAPSHVPKYQPSPRIFNRLKMLSDQMAKCQKQN